MPTTDEARTADFRFLDASVLVPRSSAPVESKLTQYQILGSGSV